ncbi:MAG: heme o synthase [Planctomycetota bacterium]|jgi:protoheme IX farnesyltransferase|nr:heme o synthase [Planctomycetota bacterium]
MGLLGNRARAYLELGKPRLSLTAVFAVVTGVYIGSPGFPDAGLVISCAVAAMLVAMGGSALNMFAERDHDGRMKRTSGRPLPDGRLRPVEGLVAGAIAVVCGVALFVVTSNLLAAGLCALIALIYVLIYTPLKRVTALNTLVGAVPGGLPPVVGYAAASGVIDMRALLLFVILFLWQIPHFLAIAWRYRDEYALGGMRMMPMVDPDGRSTGAQMIIFTVSLVVATLAAYFAGMAGNLYLVTAVVLGLIFLVSSITAGVFRQESGMRRCFLVSVVYLPVLFGVMMLDKT